MNGRFARLLVVAALAATTLLPTVTLAQSRPLPQHVLSRGVSDRARGVQSLRKTLATPPKNDRLLYGRIETVNGNILLVRTRGGRVLRVDGSDAIKSGMYSAPLFIGKLISISGFYDDARTLHAQSITREARIDARTAADR